MTTACFCSLIAGGSGVRGITSPGYSIEGRKLNFSFRRGEKDVPILKDCSLRIPAGQLWMLLGPNGCGKSTLLKILAGLLNPTSGNVRIRRPRSFVFQNPDHQVVMPTVEADVAFGLGKFNLTPEEVKSRVESALDAVGMLQYLQRPVQTLSGGQKQRVAIAGALAEACKVLLLDELTTFLDDSDQKGVIKAVKNSLGGSREVTALWVTHRLEELKYADGAVYMEDGRVVKHGDVSSISHFLKEKQLVPTLSTPNFLKALVHPNQEESVGINGEVQAPVCLLWALQGLNIVWWPLGLSPSHA